MRRRYALRSTEYSQEVEFYFLDNYPGTFDLLVKIEELRYLVNGYHRII